MEDGAIVGVQDPPGQGGFLTTYRTFKDFEFECETQVDWPFDSGIFLRVGPQGKSHQVTLFLCDRVASHLSVRLRNRPATPRKGRP